MAKLTGGVGVTSKYKIPGHMCRTGPNTLYTHQSQRAGFGSSLEN